ncbi:MAG: class I SAM-dependent methyltransferase, partial [Vicinamibacterales bacterium]
MKYERTVEVEDLDRYKADREAADRRYNDALTALDQSIHPGVQFPPPPSAPDETMVNPINERWDLSGVSPVAPPGWRGRIWRLFWPFLAPLVERQQAFNAAVVEHVNRNTPIEREAAARLQALLDAVQTSAHHVVVHQHRMIAFLQQVTAYVDTKDREFYGLCRRVSEDAMETVFALDESTRHLTTTVRTISDQTLKHVESLTARVQRDDTVIEQLRATVDVLQQHTMVLKREFARVASAPAASAGPAAGASPDGAPHAPAATGTIESWKYVGFEDLFRGPESEIRSRLAAYVPLFAGAADVLDVGCGRGEFLDLLRDAGVTCRGLDLNHEMVEVCRARGHDVAEGDALAYLQSLPDASLGGLIATQVVEHLAPDY